MSNDKRDETGKFAKAEEPAEKEQSTPVKTEGLKDTDTLPSETEPKPTSTGSGKKKKRKTHKEKKIIGLMGVVHQEGPPGSTHG